MESVATNIVDGFAAAGKHGRLHFREAGKGDVLMLVHSNGGSAYQFDAAAVLLAPHFRVISITLPGHGDSDPLSAHYSIEQYADAVAALMDALKIERAIIAGSSVGGSIAAAFGAHHRKRATSVIIIEAPCRTYQEWGARWSHTEGNFSIPLQDDAKVRERVPNATPAIVSRWNIDRSKAGARVMVDVMWAIREFDVQAALARITCPALIVYGRKGPNVADRDRLESAAPATPIHVLEDSGHFPMLDDPKAFAECLLDFANSDRQKQDA